MAKMYVATFYGDIRDQPPIAGHTLEEVLLTMQKLYGYGTYHEEKYIENGQVLTEASFVTPDPEDDMIEVWEYDTEALTAKVVWGFWGWRWTMPEGMEQGSMPGCVPSLNAMAMEDY